MPEIVNYNRLLLDWAHLIVRATKHTTNEPNWRNKRAR